MYFVVDVDDCGGGGDDPVVIENYTRNKSS
jgi:hypothetical protein